ncbi:MAG: ribonuclease III [Candidatus Omnitrophica bacterium]|nr:ribonuclease III [Candidatus Omnitrophota bacterium]
MTSLEKAIGNTFRNKKLLQAALTHPSYSTEIGTEKLPQNFQRLEFLGDAILNFFIARRLYQLFPKANEGTLSRLRSTLVSRKLLVRIAQSIRLKKYLRLGKSGLYHPDLVMEKILADAFEALIAAVYFDRGPRAVERFLAKHFKPYFNERKLFQLDPNPKSTLQEYTQKEYGTLPIYQSQFYKKRASFAASVAIKRKSRLKAKGVGRTKQEAEAHAAQTLLKKLRIYPARKKKSFSGKRNSQAS